MRLLRGIFEYTNVSNKRNQNPILMFLPFCFAGKEKPCAVLFGFRFRVLDGNNIEKWLLVCSLI